MQCSRPFLAEVPRDPDRSGLEQPHLMIKMIKNHVIRARHREPRARRMRRTPDATQARKEVNIQQSHSSRRYSDEGAQAGGGDGPSSQSSQLG